jgi:hypothetical protein
MSAAQAFQPFVHRPVVAQSLSSDMLACQSAAAQPLLIILLVAARGATLLNLDAVLIGQHLYVLFLNHILFLFFLFDDAKIKRVFKPSKLFPTAFRNPFRHSVSFPKYLPKHVV